MKVTERFVSLLSGVVLTKQNDVMVNSEELTGTREYLTLYTRCRISRYCYNRVRLYSQSQSYGVHITSSLSRANMWGKVRACRILYEQFPFQWVISYSTGSDKVFC